MIEQLKRILPLVKKPARYVGGEYNCIIKDKKEVDLRVAFCFPDTYEIGMSHLGLRILYGLINNIDGVWCERAFAPWIDMEEKMREANIPLYGLESGDALSDFDVLAFTLQYEMSYTNILNMLDMGGVPLRAQARGDAFPLVIAGGPCAFNPEPMAPFIDLFVLGEGEEIVPELLELCRTAKREKWDKPSLLKKAAGLSGVYVPSLYDVEYNPDGTVRDVTARDGAPKTVEKRIIRDFSNAYFPTEMIVPSTEVVHDRVMLELFRGCIRGCRFCQAGFTNRPVRMREPELLVKQGIASCMSAGYEEISLTSLSTSDYKGLDALSDGLLDWCQQNSVSLSLPSLRADNFSVELMEKVQRVRKSGLTFAPEAGTQRLRDAINKNVLETDVLNACAIAFAGGWSTVKLYFMIGLPTETDEDILGIAELAEKVFQEWRRVGKSKKRGVKITVSVAGFVPKPMTPFQWEAQDTMDELARKQELLRGAMRKNITLNWHDAQTTMLEGVLARGDRRLGDVIERAFLSGCRLDSWGECFSLSKWLSAFEECGLDPAFYANRVRPENEVLAWDHLSTGVSRAYLYAERSRAYSDVTTPDCRHRCSMCGASELIEGGVCDV